jgi:hypothetical protein
MYQRDVKAIIEISEAKQSVLPAGTFVLTTIQSALFQCKNQIKDTNINGSGSKYMWGKKGDGYDYMRKHDGFLWGKINYIKETMGTDSVEACVAAIELFLPIPNLGMVKAAFMAQCLGFNVACIDSHNLKRLGMNENQVKLGKVKPETRRKKITAYVEMTQLEGTQYWWDTWCEYVAGNRANRQLDSGDIVSRYHVECVDLVEV